MTRLTFIEQPLQKGRKTAQFDIWTDGGHGFFLGKISWYAQWRRFCFYPANHSTFDRSCLQEICEKIDAEMAVRTEKQEAAR